MIMLFETDASQNHILNKIANQDESVLSQNLDQVVSDCGLHTPLSVACQTGSLTYVNQLLAIDEIRKDAGALNNRALQVAASQGFFDIVRRLTELSDIRDHLNDLGSDLRFLVYPIENKHWDVVNLLLTFLQPRATQDLVSIIIEGGQGLEPVNISESDMTQLLMNPKFKRAAEISFADHDKQLFIKLTNEEDWPLLLVFLNQLSNFTSVSADNNHVLQMAIQHQKIDIVEKLLQIPTVINVIKADDDNMVFLEALHTGNQDLILKLLTIDSIREKANHDLEEVEREATNAEDGSILEWINEQLSVGTYRPR
jgi:ankyrin repeat protein